MFSQMKNSLFFILSCILVLSATACLQKEITLDFPASEPRLVLEGLLIDGLPIMMQVSKTTNFNEEAFTFNVPNNTDVWILKNGEAWLQLLPRPDLSASFLTSPFSSSFFALDTIARLERGSRYIMRVSLAGFPTLETAEMLYEGRRPEGQINLFRLSGEDVDLGCLDFYQRLDVIDAGGGHFIFRRGSELLSDFSNKFPELNEVERAERIASIRRSRILSALPSIRFLFQESYGIETNFSVILKDSEDISLTDLDTALCVCDPAWCGIDTWEVIEAPSSLTDYLLVQRQYIDLGDAGLFSQQNLPPIPHNVINGYGYFGLANNYVFPLCREE